MPQHNGIGRAHISSYDNSPVERLIKILRPVWNDGIRSKEYVHDSIHHLSDIFFLSSEVRVGNPIEEGDQGVAMILQRPFGIEFLL